MEKEVRVYPKPATSELHIYAKNRKLNFQLIDIFGNVLHQTVENTIDVSELRSGLYFIRISQDDELLQITKVLVN